MTFYIILSFSTFFISLIGTRLVILALRNKVVAPDVNLLTGKRKATLPTDGGIALVFAVISGFLAVEVNYNIIAAIFLLMGLPLLRSVLPFPRTIKLLARLAVVVISLGVFSQPILSEFLLPLLDKSLAVFLWLWVIHSFEKLEVVEGLMPVQMISIGVGIYAINILSGTFFSPLSIQALIIATSGMGFLWWNYHPAKVLAGEIASVPVGFIAGYLLLLAAHNGYLAEALIIPAYFLSDSFITFFNRPFSEKFATQQESKTRPPYCMRAIKNSNSPQWIVRTITGINMFLIFLATQALLYPEMAVFNVTVAYSMTFALVFVFARIKNKTVL